MTWKPRNLAPNATGNFTCVVTEVKLETTVLFKTDDGKVPAGVRMIGMRKN
jgi:hypothetical protein